MNIINDAFAQYLWQVTESKKPPKNLIVLTQMEPNGVTSLASRGFVNGKEQWFSYPTNEKRAAPLFWCRIIRNHHVANISTSIKKTSIEFCDNETRAKWFTRVPTKTIEKLRKEYPAAKVESQQIMVHERSRPAYAVKITSKNGVIQYLS